MGGGRVPHIVFNPDVAEDAYFPGPAFWAATAPSGRATLGLTQPPLHARAALAVGDAAFLRRVFPQLAAGTATWRSSVTWAAAASRRSCTRGFRDGDGHPRLVALTERTKVFAVNLAR